MNSLLPLALSVSSAVHIVVRRFHGFDWLLILQNDSGAGSVNTAAALLPLTTVYCRVSLLTFNGMIVSVIRCCLSETTLGVVSWCLSVCLHVRPRPRDLGE